MMPEFQIRQRFTFEGVVYVKADTLKEAQEISTRDFGVILGQPHTTNDDQIVDWEFPTHPEQEIIQEN